MGFQIYLIHPKDTTDAGVRDALADYVAGLGGFILMATSYGSIIVAVDDRYAGALSAHPLVELSGGITLNPNGLAAERLQQLFAYNVATQLNARRQNGAPPASQQYNGIPGYRPMRRPTQDQEGGGFISTTLDEE